LSEGKCERARLWWTGELNAKFDLDAVAVTGVVGGEV
jgi:hypothetical protein